MLFEHDELRAANILFIMQSSNKMTIIRTEMIHNLPESCFIIRKCSYFNLVGEKSH